MGIRKRIKGRIKQALGVEPPKAASSVSPAAPSPKPSDSAGGGNLSGGEDVPWYLKYEDVDGWDNTNATDDLDSE